MSMMRKNLVFFWLMITPLVIAAQDFRPIDAAGNNLSNPEWGAAEGPIADLLPTGFEDGISLPARSQQMNPRRISNRLFEQLTSEVGHLGLSDFTWAFGQFIDHDISLVHSHPQSAWITEGAPIVIPDDDPYMSPGKVIPLMRSKEITGTGVDKGNPRKYSNDITAFIDGSAIYGSNIERARWLRQFEGGRLKTSLGNRLPWNTIDGEFNSPVDPSAPVMEDAIGEGRKLFVAGDVRANENPLLLSLHMLFVREHNRLCYQYLEDNPELDPRDPTVDEFVYQRSRKIVGAILQYIVYDEWLPSLGVDPGPYEGYDPQTDPSISNVFSAAAYRWGHTAISSVIQRIELDGSASDHGHIDLEDAFFNPLESLRMPLELYLKGMGMQEQQGIDCKMVGAIRNFLFKDNPVIGGLDLAAINIQRGRERGLTDYNTIRESYGLDRKEAFIEICIDETLAGILEEVYGTVDNIDPWVGMLAEDHLPGSLFGELVQTIMIEQFDALRTGDRYFYLNDPWFSEADIEVIENSTLTEVIKRNTEIECMQPNVFFQTPHNEIPCWPYVAPTSLDIAIAPNPVVDHTYLNIYSAQSGRCHIRIANNIGQILLQTEKQLTEGENHIDVDWSNVRAKGALYVMVEMGDDLHTLKVVKL